MTISPRSVFSILSLQEKVAPSGVEDACLSTGFATAARSRRSRADPSPPTPLPQGERGVSHAVDRPSIGANLMTDTPHLFRPLALRGLELSNRIVVSPMCQYSAVEGVPQNWHLQHIGCFAASGPGLVMVEATGVEAIGRISPRCTGIYSDDCERQFAHVVRIAKSIGLSRIGIQLGHAGRKGSTAQPAEGGKPLRADDPQAWRTVGPSAIPFAPDW